VINIIFPNPSRIFLESNQSIRFWGYVNVTEIEFSIELDAIRMLKPESADTQAGMLSAFDENINQIHKVAKQFYEQSEKRSTRFTLKKELLN
jgi:hypothetical protein